MKFFIYDIAHGLIEILTNHLYFFPIFNKVVIILYFSYMLKFAFITDIFSKQNTKISIFSENLSFLNISKWCKFTNIFNFYYLYTISIIIIVFLIGYLILYSIFSIKYKYIEKNNKIIRFLNYIFATLIYLFFWIFIIPLVETFVIPFFVTDCINEKSFVLEIFSVFLISLIFFTGLIYLYFQQDYDFLSKGYLNFQFSYLVCLILLFRVILIISSFISNVLSLIFLHIIAILSIIEYLLYFPIRDKILNRFYFSILLMFYGIIISITSFRINIIDEENLVFIIFMLSILFYKLGFIISEKLYYKIIISNFKNKNSFDYLLEELYLLFYSKGINSNCLFLYGGIINKHSKFCKNANCKISTFEKLQSFFNSKTSEQGSKLISLIDQFFQIAINLPKKEFLNNIPRMEKLILSYFSFLIENNCQWRKVLFLMVKIRSKMGYVSPLFEIRHKLKYSFVRKKLIIYQTRKEMNQSQENQLKLFDFFQNYERKSIVEKECVQLLKNKIVFWRRYLKGFNRYEDLIITIVNFMRKVDYFKKLIITLDSDSIIHQKFKSILNSIVLNTRNLSLESEKSIDIIKQKYYHKDNDKLTPITLLNTNTIFCQISLLTNKGKLLEISKTEKLADFFGYNFHEIKLWDTITNFMPEFISQKHPIFIKNAIKSTEMDSFKETIDSFALKKNGTIFPVKLFLTQSYEVSNEIILNVALRKIENSKNLQIVCDLEGIILGISEPMFEFFKKELDLTEINDFKLLNICVLCPKIGEFIKNNFESNEKDNIFRNQNGCFFLPKNMIEIIQILKKKYKTDQIQIEKDLKNTIFSFNSLVKSSKSNINEKTLEEYSNSTLGRYKSIIKDSPNISILFKRLLDLKKCEMKNFLFDINSKTYIYGDTSNEKLKILIITFQKLSSENRNSINKLTNQNELKLQTNKPSSEILIIKVTNSKNEVQEEKAENLENEEKESEISSKKNSEKINEEDFKSHNPTNNIIENFEEGNHSSVSSWSETFTIYKYIDIIKNKKSLHLFRMLISQKLQIIIMIIFCIIMFFTTRQYVDLYYIPLQDGNINQMIWTKTIFFCTLVITEYELEIWNITKLTDIERNYYPKIIEENFIETFNLFTIERNKPTRFEYQYLIKSSLSKHVDHQTKKMKNIQFVDQVDNFLDTINIILKTDPKDLYGIKDFLPSLGRNIPYFISTNRNNRDIIQIEFLESNKDISDYTFTLLIIFLCIVFPPCIYQFYCFSVHNNSLMDLLNIFLRINNSEVQIEINNINHVLNIFNEGKDLYLQKNYYYDENKNNELKQKDKHSKEKNYRDIKSLSKLKFILILLIILIIINGYLSSSYFFWNSTNTKIQEIIELNIIFGHLFLYSGNVFLFYKLQFRDKVLNNTVYEKISDSTQTSVGRQDFFYSRIQDRLLDLNNYMKILPTNSIESRSKMNDPDFNILLEGNLCDLLYRYDTLNKEEEKFCETAFNGVFLNGIFSFLKQYINDMTQYLSLSKTINKTADPTGFAKQRLTIIKFLNSLDSHELFLSIDIACKSMLIYFWKQSEFYIRVMNESFVTTQIFLWVSCFLAGGILFLISIAIYKINKINYNYCLSSINLIPFGKLVEDPQIISLLKNYSLKKT